MSNRINPDQDAQNPFALLRALGQAVVAKDIYLVAMPFGDAAQQVVENVCQRAGLTAPADPEDGIVALLVANSTQAFICVAVERGVLTAAELLDAAEPLNSAAWVDKSLAARQMEQYGLLMASGPDTDMDELMEKFGVTPTNLGENN